MCGKNRHELLGIIVGRGILDVPPVELSEYGKILEQSIKFVNNSKKDIDIVKYVIMPNHVYLIVVLRDLRSVSGGGRNAEFVPCGGQRTNIL